MTRDDIIHMAQKARIAESLLIDDWPKLKSFAALVAAQEREACAQVADSLRDSHSRFADYISDVGTAIRNRGQL